MDWFEAARNGAIEVLETFLRSGQTVDQRSSGQHTGLRVAAEHGQTTVVKLLLDRGADANLDVPGVGRPLTAAVQNEHWETAAALVRGGADPNADGVASIVIAAPPKKQLFALMLRHGLDPNGAHPQWGPYVQFALNDSAIADMLFGAGFDLSRYERETGESLLERALLSEPPRFEQLLKMGADVNLPIDRRSGRTMLMFLAAEDTGETAHELIRLLVKRGADVEQADADGKTALDYASQRSDDGTLALLTRLRDNARRAKQKAAEAARIAAEQAAEAARRAAENEAARARRSAAAKKAAATRRAAAEQKAAQAKRHAAAPTKTRAKRKPATKPTAKPKKKPKPAVSSKTWRRPRATKMAQSKPSRRKPSRR